MPRAVNGTYTLPAGNPVVTGTTISSVWANTTLSDLGTAMTDSLSRSGQGAMTAPLQLTAGAIGAPGLTWSVETTSGLYRAGAGDFRFSIAAVDVWKITAAGVTSGFADGLVGTPSIYFTSDPDTGFYHIVADQIGMALGGVLQFAFAASELTLGSTVSVRGNARNAASPTYSFTAAASTGMYLSGAPAIGFSVNNSLRLTLDTTNATFAGPANATIFRAGDGTVGAPSFSFTTDTDTGFYRVTANEFRFSSGGTFSAVFGLNYIQSIGQFFSNDGTVGNPAYTFAADPNTGFYRDTADQIAISLGGVTAGQIAQGSFTGTYIGGTTAPTATFFYQRIGNHVTIYCVSNLTATSNSNNFGVSGAPAIIRPTTQVDCGCSSAVDNSVLCTFRTAITSAGNLNFFRLTVVGANLVDTNWTSSGTKTLNTGYTISYMIN